MMLPWRRCLRAALRAGSSPPPDSFYNGLSGAGAGPFRGDAAASTKPIVQKREGLDPRLTARKWRIARPLPGALRPAYGHIAGRIVGEAPRRVGSAYRSGERRSLRWG